jgi:riboflavin kinase
MAHSCEMNGIHIPTLPLYFKGQVVRGFGRGSRTLGFPTANLDPKCFADKLTTSDEGVYFGWSRLNNEEPIEQMVMSIGYNPQFGNQTKTVEVHILKEYNREFYGECLRVIAVGWIRHMQRFADIESLVAAIKKDIAIAKERLKEPKNERFKYDRFLTEPLS